MDAGRRDMREWDDTEVVPPGGRCFALLAPRSLRPSGHLRCASSPPPSGLVVSAVIWAHRPGGLVVSAVDSRAQTRPCRIDGGRRGLREWDDTEVVPPWGARIMFRNYITSLQNTIGIF
jgi:hypothetical protein